MWAWNLIEKWHAENNNWRSGLREIKILNTRFCNILGYFRLLVLQLAGQVIWNGLLKFPIFWVECQKKMIFCLFIETFKKSLIFLEYINASNQFKFNSNL